MTELLQHALASGARDVAPAPARTRTALAVGTLGRLGEELLNVLVETPAYHRVHVGTCAPFASWVAKVIPMRIDSAMALAAVDDVYVALGGTHSRLARDRAYFRANLDDVLPIARAARAAGASRFVLLAPLDAFTQMSAIAAGISNEVESALSRMGFRSLLVVRPTEEDRRQGGSPGERLARMLASTVLHYVLPPSVQPLRARRVAEATVKIAVVAEGGTRVVGARELTEIVGGPENKRRRY